MINCTTYISANTANISGSDGIIFFGAINFCIAFNIIGCVKSN